MSYPLENEYGLTAYELLDAISGRFRLKVALEGAVAEVQLRRKIQALQGRRLIRGFEEHDINGHPDFTVWPARQSDGLLLECKNVRDDAYKRQGNVVAYKVEVQKTRAAISDPSSRFYPVDYFQLLAVCLGKQPGNWSDFLFARSQDLDRHATYPDRLAVFQRVPLLASNDVAPWYRSLEEVLGAS